MTRNGKKFTFKQQVVFILQSYKTNIYFSLESKCRVNKITIILANADWVFLFSLTASFKQEQNNNKDQGKPNKPHNQLTCQSVTVLYLWLDHMLL